MKGALVKRLFFGGEGSFVTAVFRGTWTSVFSVRDCVDSSRIKKSTTLFMNRVSSEKQNKYIETAK